MKLKRLELLNYCQFAHLVWEFEEGLVAIVGPNGSGKTNAITAAYVALTRDYRHVLGKKGMVRQQKKRGEESSICLQLEHAGSEYELLVNLSSGGTSLTVAGGEPLTNAVEIKALLEESLGLSTRVLSEYVFIRQGTLADIFTSSGSERAKTFAKLCNTLRAEQLYQLLGEELSKHARQAQAPVEELNSIVQHGRELQSTLQGWVAKRRQAREALTNPEVFDRLQQQKLDYELAQRLEPELVQLTEQEEVRKRKAKQAKQVQDQLQQELEQVETELEEVTAEAERLAAARREWDAQDARRNERAEAASAITLTQAQLNRLVEPKQPKSPYPAAKHADYKADRRRLKRTLEMLESGKTECPQCGTLVSELDADGLQEELDDLQIKIAALDKRQRLWEAYETKKSAVDTQRSKLQTQLELREKELKKFANVTEPQGERPDHYLAQERRARLATRVKPLRKRANEAAQTFTTLATMHRELKTRLANTQEQWDALPDVTEPEYRQACKQLLEAQTAQEQFDEASEEIRTRKPRYQQLRAKYERLWVQVHQARKLQAWLQLVTEMREVVHRDNLPHDVHLATLKLLEAKVNGFLLKFRDPFTVRATEDLSLLATFATGTQIPAAGLSGGQKAMLATALWLTINELFAGKLGVLVLDEPTDGLDQDHRAAAAEIFAQLKDEARNSGRQIFVITHDEQLQAAFDHCHVLRAPE